MGADAGPPGSGSAAAGRDDGTAQIEPPAVVERPASAAAPVLKFAVLLFSLGSNILLMNLTRAIFTSDDVFRYPLFVTSLHMLASWFCSWLLAAKAFSHTAKTITARRRTIPSGLTWRQQILLIGPLSFCGAASIATANSALLFLYPHLHETLQNLCPLFNVLLSKKRYPHLVHAALTLIVVGSMLCVGGEGGVESAGGVVDVAVDVVLADGGMAEDGGSSRPTIGEMDSTTQRAPRSIGGLDYFLPPVAGGGWGTGVAPAWTTPVYGYVVVAAEGLLQLSWETRCGVLFSVLACFFRALKLVTQEVILCSEDMDSRRTDLHRSSTSTFSSTSTSERTRRRRMAHLIAHIKSLDSICLLYYSSPVNSALLALLAFLSEGPLPAVRFLTGDLCGSTYALIILSGLVAAAFNVCAFVQVQVFGALTSSLVGQIKLSLSLFVGVLLFGRKCSEVQTLGFVLSLTGAVLYQGSAWLANQVWGRNFFRSLMHYRKTNAGGGTKAGTPPRPAEGEEAAVGLPDPHVEVEGTTSTLSREASYAETAVRGHQKLGGSSIPARPSSRPGAARTISVDAAEDNLEERSPTGVEYFGRSPKPDGMAPAANPELKTAIASTSVGTIGSGSPGSSGSRKRLLSPLPKVYPRTPNTPLTPNFSPTGAGISPVQRTWSKYIDRGSFLGQFASNVERECVRDSQFENID
eukprot:g2961.t1